MDGWPKGNKNYIFEEVTEKHKPPAKTSWCLSESLSEGMLRLDNFECSKGIWKGQWITMDKVFFKKIFMLQATQEIYFKNTHSLI